MTCSAPPARTGPPAAGCARTTGHTGPTWNVPSPRWPPGGDAASSSATAEWPGTTPGSSAAPPRSTCATCSARAWPAATAPGRWPPDRPARLPGGGPYRRSVPRLAVGPGPAHHEDCISAQTGRPQGSAQKRRPGYAKPQELAFFSTLLGQPDGVNVAEELARDRTGE